MPHDPGAIAALLYGVILIIGVVAGCRGDIVVFADLSDLVLTFSIMAGAVVGSMVLLNMLDHHQQLAATLACIVLASAFLAICYRSWRQNGSLLATALAILTKAPFAAAVPLLMLQVATPKGKTASERAGNRASALLLLMIIAPLLIALVRDKDGMRRYLGVA